MAVTAYGTGAPETRKLWARKLFREALKNTQLSQFMGESSNSMVQVKTDSQKDAGDRIRCTLRMQLTGAGVSGDGTLEGNEEALSTFTDDLLIDQLRNAVKSAGEMTNQRIDWSIREESMLGLQDWISDRWDTAWLNQMAGNTAQTDTRFTGSNATVTFDSSHVVYPNNLTTEASVAAASASAIMTLELIDFAVEKAKTLTPMIKPVNVQGEKMYVIILHPEQATDLRTNTNTGQWLDIQKAAMQGGRISDNPIFKDALGVYHNTVIHENTRIPLAPGQTTVRRAVFAGAQACIMGFGKKNQSGKIRWDEELFDYGNQLGVASSMIWGIKKTIFNSLDFSTIVVPTYSVPHG